MKILLKVIEFEDYRNIKNGERLILGPLITLVGVNETGKTNLIRAIQLINEDFNFGGKQDVKIGSKRADQGKTPILKYYFELNDIDLIDYFRNITNYAKEDYLVFIMDDEGRYQIGFSKKDFKIKPPQYKKQWENISSNPIKIPSLDSIEIEIQNGCKFQGTKTNRYRLPKLKKDHIIEEVSREEIEKEVLDYVLNNVLPDVEFWEYKEEKHYIRDDVPFAQFINNSDDFPSTKNLFIVAGIENQDLNDYITPLKNNPDQEKQNFLDKIGEAIDAVIKKTWRQSDIQLKLNYQSDKIRIDVWEGGRRTLPSTRSDGLKWFLSFLLDFRSRGELINKIIMFDQPGEKLHPGGQKELKVRFKEIASQNQIIFATQSPFLIDRNSWPQVKFLKKISGDSIIKEPSKYDIENDELLRYSLGFSLLDVGLANDWNIVVEGYDDQFVLKDIARRLNYLNLQAGSEAIFDFNKTGIFEKRGASSIKKRVDELLNVGLKAIGIFDSDDMGGRELKKIQRGKKAKKLFYSISELVDNEKIQTAEDLLPVALWKNACKDFLKNNKVNNSIFDCPRVANFKNFYKKIASADFGKDKKEQIWNIIFDRWEEFFEKNDINKLQEIKFIKKMLEKTSKILTEQKKEVY